MVWGALIANQQRLPVAMRWLQAHLAPMANKSPLDDPENAAFAWARFRSIMRLLGAVTAATIAITLGLLYAYNGFVSLHFYIAVALGIGLTMMLGGGLMGLAFMSNGTGHDEAVDNRLPSADELFDRRSDD